MTVPEWAMITLVSCILAVMGWAATRLVKSNDDTALALDGIEKQLGLVNGRLGKTELWQLMHGDDDANRFTGIAEVQKGLWYAINKRS